MSAIGAFFVFRTHRRFDQRKNLTVPRSSTVRAVPVAVTKSTCRRAQCQRAMRLAVVASQKEEWRDFSLEESNADCSISPRRINGPPQEYCVPIRLAGAPRMTPSGAERANFVSQVRIDQVKLVSRRRL
jgi:hypothetical protein